MTAPPRTDWTREEIGTLFNLPFDELILEKFDPASENWGWVHVSYAGAQNRGKISTFDGRAYHDGLLDLPVVS